LQQGNYVIGDSGDRTLYVLTAGDPRQFISTLRREVQALDSNLPLYGVKTFADQKSESLTQERLIATLSGFFGALALLLASIGLYGVMAYNVNQRTREIGIRMSMGATNKSVLWMILRDCLWTVIAGISIGIPLSFWLSKLVASQLFGVPPGDPMTIVVATLVLATVATLAGFIPARRASHVDPIIALRYE
jgi:ABC-type antimicrobial peptide transport system permease subunit